MEQANIYHAITEDDADKLQQILKTDINVNAPLVSIMHVCMHVAMYAWLLLCDYCNMGIIMDDLSDIYVCIPKARGSKPKGWQHVKLSVMQYSSLYPAYQPYD